jgi:hypothetical protein
MPLSGSERSQRATLASHRSWANTSDPSARTKPARQPFDKRFEDDVDPDRILPEPERLRRAESAKKAYFAALALKSAKARREKKAAKRAS